MLRSTLAAALVAAAIVPAGAVQGTLSTASDTKSGDIKYLPRAKKYALTYKKGKTDINAEYPVSDVTDLDIDKPAGYDKAVAAVESGAGAGAIPTLEKIVSEYRMLVWDKPAGRYLVLAYLAANQLDKAEKTCRDMIADDKTASWKGDLAPAYWQTLLKLGKVDPLERELKKAITSGDRRSSAAAAILRGDIILRAGDSPDNLRQALRDGYLRTALMYGEPECRGERSEALLKAAACFDKLGQAARADKLRTQAKSM